MADAAPLHVAVAGRGPAVLLLHGGLANGTLAWQKTVEHLQDRLTLVVPDRRGHGKSPAEPRPYTIARDAADVLAAADRLGYGRLHWVGHSYGAIVALHAARQAPERVASLHLIEPPLLALLPSDPDVAALTAGTRRIWHMARQWPAARVAEEFLALVAGEAFVAKLKERPVWSALVAEARRLKDEEHPAEYLPDLWSGPPPFPVAVYSGGRSHPGLRKIARTLSARLPGADFIEFPEAYHDVHNAGAPFEQALLRYVEAG